MRIAHIAIWARDIEKLRKFYANYFGAQAGPLYINSRNNFSSYFLRFSTGCQLEIMQMENIRENMHAGENQYYGFAHLAISVGSRDKVDQIAVSLTSGGYRILDGPRITGDGYYEAVVLDPEGNRLEITS